MSIEVRRRDPCGFDVCEDGRWSSTTLSARTAAGLREAANRDEARTNEALRRVRRIRAIAAFVAKEEIQRLRQATAKATESRWHSAIARRAKAHRFCLTCIKGETHVCGQSLDGCKNGHCDQQSHKVDINYSLGIYRVKRRTSDANGGASPRSTHVAPTPRSAVR